MSRRELKDLYISMIKLPVPMIANTLKKLSASDVFHFSLISPEHLEHIRSTKDHALSGAEIKLEVTSPEEMEIRFAPVNPNVSPFVLAVKDMEMAASNICENTDLDQEINGIPMKIDMMNGNWSTAYVPSGFGSKIALINYCFDNLHCQGISFHFEDDSHQISIYQPLVEAFKECQDVWIGCSSETQTNDDMETFLRGIQISRRFNLSLLPMRPLNLPPSVFSANKMLILPLIVMTRVTLLSINCECSIFYNTDLTTDDLSAFVVKWFSSDETKLKRLKVGTDIEIEQLDLSSIPGQFIEPMDNGKTKIVKADGTFAVVILERYSFDFRVSDEEVEFY